ncbi:hypothetical protein [Blastopirellula retiformator]|uniref:Uncharacterized protein n=1 Tax=Blastopirellula retiformator TaxID=2527970 RepID=A0A5C5UUG7_9BACT|nr:hypothetical protein [Blastopirellula retiformator]TWT29956.1 hypothetical protein Enr8_46130 [Blastopirellula retiformator]
MAKATPEAYINAVRHLGQEKRIEQTMLGKIQVPDGERLLRSPFPPVLLPMWVTGAGTIQGLWSHWFSERSPTFVEFYGITTYGKRNMAFERGRTFKQAIYEHLFNSITNRDGIDDEIRTFAAACGIDDLDEVDQMSLDGGDVTMLKSHPEFLGKVPLSFFDYDNQAGYTGDFPSIEIVKSKGALKHYCVHEIHSGFKSLQPDFTLRDAVAQDAQSPEWFRTPSQKKLFGKLLDANDLEGAWMCLNSPRWALGDARQAITDLADRANDIAFSALATTWVNLPFSDDEVI